MPAAPVLLTAAVATGTAATVGTAVVAAVTTATVSTAVATAVGAGVIAGGITAASGGDAGDILKSAVITGASVGLGGVAGEATGKAVAAKGASEAVTRVASSAAQNGVGSGTAALIATGDVGKALEAGAIGGVAGGAGELASVKAQQALPASAGRTTQAVTAGGAGGATEALVRGQDPLTGAALSALGTAGRTAYQDAQDAENLARAESFLARNPTAMAGAVVPATRTDIEETRALGIDLPETGVVPQRLGEITVTGERELISPALQSTYYQPPKPKQTRGVVVSATDTNAMIMKPSGDVVQINTGGTPLKPNMAVNIDETTNTLVREPTDTGIREDIATEDEARRLGEVEVTGEREPIERVSAPRTTEEAVSQTFPLTEPESTKRSLVNYMYQNVDPVLQRSVGGGGSGMPSSTALAQALGVGDPGALYLGKKGKERRPVWNVESLKLRDELGGDYG